MLWVSTAMATVVNLHTPMGIATSATESVEVTVILITVTMRNISDGQV